MYYENWNAIYCIGEGTENIDSSEKWWKNGRWRDGIYSGKVREKKEE